MLVSKIVDELITEKAKIDWLAYWQHFSTVKQHFCCEINCTNESNHGVLVKVVNHEDEIYVVPLCKAHSENSQQLEVSNDTEIVSAALTL